MRKKNAVSVNMIKERLSYNPDTGEIFWRVRNANMKPGDPAGTRRPDGYIKINVDKYQFYAHRLAWALHYGVYPTKYIDHINGNPSDNRIANLREVTNRQNALNQKKHRDRNVGVSFCRVKKMWRVRIFCRKEIMIGYFEDLKEARRAYDQKYIEVMESLAFDQD